MYIYVNICMPHVYKKNSGFFFNFYNVNIRMYSYIWILIDKYIHSSQYSYNFEATNIFGYNIFVKETLQSLHIAHQNTLTHIFQKYVVVLLVNLCCAFHLLNGCPSVTNVANIAGRRGIWINTREDFIWEVQGWSRIWYQLLILREAFTKKEY